MEELYNSLKESDLLPSNFTGVWEKDKNKFIELQNKIDSGLLENYNLEDDFFNDYFNDYEL